MSNSYKIKNHLSPTHKFIKSHKLLFEIFHKFRDSWVMASNETVYEMLGRSSERFPVACYEIGQKVNIITY